MHVAKAHIMLTINKTEAVTPGEIMKVLSALMAKSDQIEAALHTKADVSAMEDLAMRITCVRG